MGSAERVLEEIAERIVGVYGRPPPEALAEARKALVDTLAVTAAAVWDDTARRHAERLAQGGEGPVPVPGLWVRRGRLEAAAANAFLAHSLELDDWLAPGYVHAGSVVVPALVSAGHEHSVEHSLRLVVAGYEAALLVGGLLGRSHYRVWHSTATAGTAAAATVAVLAQDPPSPIEALTAALGLALVYAGGLWAVNRARALYKPLSPSQAVVKGLLVADAAVAQPACLPGVVEDVCRALSGDCRPPDTGRPGILLNGYKFYPSCRHSHTAVEAAERLSRRLSSPSSVEKIVVETYEEAIRVAGKQEPRSIEEARFSLPLLVAAAIAYGRLGLEELRRALNDDVVRGLAGRVVLVERREYTEAYPWRQPATVRVLVEGGAVLEETVLVPRGDPERRPSLEDIVAKAHVLSEAAGDPRVRVLAETLAKATGEGLGDAIWSAAQAPP